MVSYRETLVALLRDDRKTRLARTLKKGPMPFRDLMKVSGYKHSQSLTRTLRKLESLGLVEHFYRHGSEVVYSFYELTRFGEDALELHDRVESVLSKTKPEARPGQLSSVLAIAGDGSS